MLSPGYVLNERYEILSLLAAGGMGEVYRARRVLLGDEVAVKIINTTGRNEQVLRRRFMRESQTCAQLRHPNIVAIHDFSIAAGGLPYLVMEYLNGASVREELAAMGPWSLARVQQEIPPICSAIQIAHDREIIHRDIKPGNIVGHHFETGETVYKIIDFGLAEIIAASTTDQLTDSNRFVGTVDYASPEQLQGETVTPSADIYSLGAVVFELLTGRPPFVGPSTLTVVTQHLCSQPPGLTELCPGLPKWLDSTVRKALAKNPQDRYATVTEFGQALLAETERTGFRSAPAPGLSALQEKYDLGPLLGSGRLGSQVYAGTHRALGLPVAIRVLRRQGRRDWEAVRQRFLKEARALQVPHPSILQVRDFGLEGDLLYVITDLIAGTSLREYLRLHGPLDWQRLTPLGLQLIKTHLRRSTAGEP